MTPVSGSSRIAALREAERSLSMVTTLGSGSQTFEVVEGWPKLPAGFELADCFGGVVDSKNRVYLATRGAHPVVVLDLEGNLLSTWGEGLLKAPHGIAIAPDDSIYCTDLVDNVIRKLTPEGQLLQTIGGPADRFGGAPFNLPSHLAVSPVSGDLFITDGYGNSRVHRYSPDGKLLHSWGEAGTGPGQFVVPHNIVIDEDEKLYVADRENHRVQVFTAAGEHLATWPGIWRAAGVALDPDGNVVVSEMPPPVYILDAPGLGHAVSIYTKEGKLQARFGDPTPGLEPGMFSAPHSLTIDSHGDIYVCEMPDSNMGEEWNQEAARTGGPGPLRSVVKLAKKAVARWDAR